jgi:anti-sigma B factor antagonist
MKLTITPDNSLYTVLIEGRLDTLTAPQAQTDLLDAADQAAHMILDANSLSYISSTGLRVLLMVQKHLKIKKGHLTIVGLAPELKTVFDISGFTSLFYFSETLEEAKKSLI